MRNAKKKRWINIIKSQIKLQCFTQGLYQKTITIKTTISTSSEQIFLTPHQIITQHIYHTTSLRVQLGVFCVCCLSQSIASLAPLYSNEYIHSRPLYAPPKHTEIRAYPVRLHICNAIQQQYIHTREASVAQIECTRGSPNDKVATKYSLKTTAAAQWSAAANVS